MGSRRRSSYGPDYLLDHDVILEIIDSAFLDFYQQKTGNFGLKDQAFLLQWVQGNIEHFGGNRNSLTIWGGMY